MNHSADLIKRRVSNLSMDLQTLVYIPQMQHKEAEQRDTKERTKCSTRVEQNVLMVEMGKKQQTYKQDG